MDRKKRAAAIRYNPGDEAPKVVATGKGHVAERILEIGAQHDIPTYYNPELAEELSKTNIGENIPPELYEVVAQVLVFIGNLDKHQASLNRLRG